MSRQGLTYRTANGQAVPNEGEKILKGYTDSGSLAGLTTQVAKIKKTLEIGWY